MTKKDFELIASALRYAMPSKVAKPRGFAARLEAWENVVEVMASELANTNPRFDAERFINACTRED